MSATNWTGSIRFGETEVPVKIRPAAGRESAEPESGRRIEVCEFIKTREIDPVFLERVCYLEPAGPARGYDALVAALREKQAEGVCIWTVGKRACLASLRAAGKSLMLSVLRYADAEPEEFPRRKEGPACMEYGPGRGLTAGRPEPAGAAAAKKPAHGFRFAFGPGAAACLNRLLDARAETAFFARALGGLEAGAPSHAPGTGGKRARASGS
ncbi:MAG: hypothetical protein A2X32_09735 [Elusimicrobia bacterium GWC2_64_44]|nr:MAG: hypothetical protein A2X32_09735 [Elusimicrobia bacterium GWC2_64_44]